MIKFIFMFCLFSSATVWPFHPNESVYKDIWKEPISYYREQNESLIDWDSLIDDVWFNFHLWKSSRALQDKRDKANYTAVYADKKEIMGKILACHGECWANRGLEKAQAQFMTTIVEGDEVYTAPNSYAWIFLLDGTLIRLSPQTSLHFIEMNISPDKIFIVARLGRGHMQWLQRTPEKLHILPTPDSDSLFLPIKLIEANREFIYREGPRDQMNDFFDIVNRQYHELNHAIAKNNQWILKGRVSEHYIVLPNASLLLDDASIEAFYPELAGKSYVRQIPVNRNFRHARPLGKVEISYRGYEDLPSNETLVMHNWYEIESKGKSSVRLAQGPVGSSDWDELINSIPTFWMAREILLHRLSRPFFDFKTPKHIFEKVYGHRLWDKGFDARKAFIKKQMTRQETANIGLVEVLKEKGGWWAEPSLDGATLNKDAIESSRNQKMLEEEDLTFIANKSSGEFYYWVLSKMRK